MTEILLFLSWLIQFGFSKTMTPNRNPLHYSVHRGDMIVMTWSYIRAKIPFEITSSNVDLLGMNWILKPHSLKVSIKS